METEIKLDNPFVGLRAFEEDEDYLFFGRSAEINDLLKKFAGSRFLSVIGSSGSGKSSLVKSGLLPAIHSGFLSSGHNWRVAVMRPGDKPLANLSSALAKAGVLYDKEQTAEGIPYQPIIESTIRRSSNGLMQVYKESSIYNKNKSDESDNLLIIVDQFEELFRFSSYEQENSKGESQSLNFIKLLLTATEEKQTEFPIYVLLTMRSDFLGDCSQFRGLPEAINEGQYLVPRMTRDEIKEAITGPIAIGGAQITQSLITRLLNDVGTDIDQLPLLQHSMMRTWEAWKKRNQPDDPINLDDYLSMGGMTEALSEHANEVYNELTPEENKKYCELIFKALTDKAADVRGTRRPRSVSNLNKLTEAPTENIISIVEAFRKPGRTFLMPRYPDPIDNSTVIDISHESLMRIWDKLKVWTEEESQSAEAFKRLAEAAKREAAAEGSLWSGPELTMGLRWHERFKDNDELIIIWAEPFKKDTKQALDFLKRSNEKEIAEKEEKQQLILIEQERKEAEAKRGEKEKDNKRKTYYLIIAFVVLGLFTTGLIYFLNKVNRQNSDLNFVNNKLKTEKSLSDSLRIEAENNADSAKAYAAYALAQKDSVEKQKAISDSLTIVSQRKAAEAKVSAELAKQAEEEAKKQKAIAEGKGIKSAPNEYVRRIREGPTDPKNIKSQQFGLRLMCYTNHLNRLKKLIAPEDIEDYNSLMDKLYFNNDLYEKLYSVLVAYNREYLALNTRRDSNAFTPKSVLTGNDSAAIESALGKKIISLTVGKKGNKIFCSTNDHLIYELDKKMNTVDSLIYAGALITAMDYEEQSSVIYFGTKSGNIGYIKYATDKKNQPIFKNTFGSQISAIEFFQYHNKSFLLATGLRSAPAVYFLDENSLVHEKKLLGNVLPKEKLGRVINARFDGGIDRVILQTIAQNGNKVIYLWNPFSSELLERVKALFTMNQEYIKMLEDPKIKIY